MTTQRGLTMLAILALTAVAGCDSSPIQPTSPYSPEPADGPGAWTLARAGMVRAGCAPERTAIAGGLVVVLRTADHASERFRCQGMGRDSMLAVASTFQSLLSNGGPVHPAASTPEHGYWDLETRYREYCWVTPEWKVLGCGVFLPYFWPVWRAGLDNGGPDSNWMDELGGGGGWGSTPGTDEVPKNHREPELPECEQPFPGGTTGDPLCFRRPFQAESLIINSVMDTTAVPRFLRPISEIADPVAKAACHLAQQAFRSVWSNPGRVQVGTYNSVDSTTSPYTYAHSGQGFPGDSMHIDPHMFQSIKTPNAAARDAAKLELVRSLLHEAVHVLYPSADHTAYPQPPYTGDMYFEAIHSQNSSISCVRI